MKTRQPDLFLRGEHDFRAGFLYGGLGAGALGFIEARSRLGGDVGRFINLGGIDIDPKACADFRYLTGGPAFCEDVSKLNPAELRAMWGNEAPDCVFMSPPCKGFSGLLSKKTAALPKYQELNKLVLAGLFLVCETWPTPPALLVLENVPRIKTRGAWLLDYARDLLREYGYIFHEASHDCGEIGGLAQHRKRYLLVARHPAKVKGYVYRPPKQRVKACGEVLGELPLPGEPAAGPLHKLPRLSWLNWVRLALIPAGGDWRDLPGMAPRGERFGHADRVTDWAEPAGTVTSSPAPSSGGGAVADPRLAEAVGVKCDSRPGLMSVADWDKPANSVIGRVSVSGGNGQAAVADPRLASPVQPGEERRAHWPRYDVRPWDEPARTVAGDGSNGGYGVADPRLAESPEWFNGAYGVRPWDEPSGAVTGNGRPAAGTFAVADPRLALPCAAHPARHNNKYRVIPWERPATTVIGATRPGSGALTVADPRVRCRPRAGVYGVISWQEAAATVIGAASIDNGRFAVADPREPGEVACPVIIAADGTWHRPLTTLELAALQGLPAKVNGQPLALAGRDIAGWRERIGNAVPVQAARAIADTLLTALLASRLGNWSVTGGVWVREDGLSEDDFAPEVTP